MAVLKTVVILALCLLAFAALASAGRQDSGSGSESGSASGSEEGPAAPAGGSSHGSASKSSKGGAAGLMVSTPLFAAVSMLAVVLAGPLARLSSQ